MRKVHVNDPIKRNISAVIANDNLVGSKSDGFTDVTRVYRRLATIDIGGEVVIVISPQKRKGLATRGYFRRKPSNIQTALREFLAEQCGSVVEDFRLETLPDNGCKIEATMFRPDHDAYRARRELRDHLHRIASDNGGYASTSIQFV